MADTFPGLQQDCLDVIKRCNAMILLARQCRTAAEMANRAEVEARMDDIREAGTELAEFTYCFKPEYLTVTTGEEG